ncbi:MAG: hypothetical protein IPO18_08365 [bacterium]|nr:hypothetical protein [bacterium]
MLLFIMTAVLRKHGNVPHNAAFVMDRLGKVGPYGKSFIPLLIRFRLHHPGGRRRCAPETKREWLITVMVLPLMIAARELPIYALMIPAFFSASFAGASAGRIIYVTGSCWRCTEGAVAARGAVPQRERGILAGWAPPYRLPAARSAIVGGGRANLLLKKAAHLDPRRLDHPSGA